MKVTPLEAMPSSGDRVPSGLAMSGPFSCVPGFRVMCIPSLHSPSQKKHDVAVLILPLLHPTDRSRERASTMRSEATMSCPALIWTCSRLPAPPKGADRQQPVAHAEHITITDETASIEQQSHGIQTHLSCTLLFFHSCYPQRESTMPRRIARMPRHTASRAEAVSTATSRPSWSDDW